MTTDYTERIAGLDEQIARLENRRKELLQKDRARERKARTKRLIERGAIVESVIGGVDGLTGEQFKSFIERMAKTDQARRALSEIAGRGGGIAPTKTAETESDEDAENGEDENE
jgi:hypothetical protein